MTPYSEILKIFCDPVPVIAKIMYNHVLRWAKAWTLKAVHKSYSALCKVWKVLTMRLVLLWILIYTFFFISNLGFWSVLELLIFREKMILKLLVFTPFLPKITRFVAYHSKTAKTQRLLNFGEISSTVAYKKNV